MFGPGFVVNLESGVGRGNQIRLSLDAVRIVVNNPAAALAELIVNHPFNPLEFFGG